LASFPEFISQAPMRAFMGRFRSAFARPLRVLYFIKGSKPRVFNRDDVRTPIRKCRHCDGDVKDYGGHRKYLNSKGINLKDVWDDVPPVRHSKYKNRPANELAPVILERVIKLTSNGGYQ
jgi:site-specific DNA-methyltransferase (adenine-specific)